MVICNFPDLKYVFRLYSYACGCLCSPAVEAIRHKVLPYLIRVPHRVVPNLWARIIIWIVLPGNSDSISLTPLHTQSS